MHIKILGAGACIGHPSYTTSMLIGDDTLLDCGTGVGSLSQQELLGIRRVLLTHGHLDHCGLLPLLADVHASYQGTNIEVFGCQETLTVLGQHMFNGELWPDYTCKPTPDDPWVHFRPVEVGDTVMLGEAIATALPAQHSVPALGWLVEGPWRALAFTGDSGPCPAFWRWVASVPSLTDVICEVTYSDERSHEAAQQGHMTPALLAPLLAGLPANVHLWISHTDPTARSVLLEEAQHDLPAGLHVCPLKEGTLIEL